MRNPSEPKAPSPLQASAADELLRSALVPRIKHLAFERALREHAIPAEHLPVFEPLVGELLVTYAFDLPEQFVMANPTNMSRAGLSPGEARALACANLRARLPTVGFVRGPGGSFARTGGDWEACLLLLDELWQCTPPRFDVGSVVCVPRREQLLVSDGGDAQAIAAMREAAARLFHERDDEHALSLQLMTRVGDRWKVHAQ